MEIEITISIHAPREGSDSCSVIRAATARSISIHAPREGSDLYIMAFDRMLEISIHAPREGSDWRMPSRPEKTQKISIHAPREGSDVYEYVRNCISENFYPRSPRGERQGILSTPLN